MAHLDPYSAAPVCKTVDVLKRNRNAIRKLRYTSPG